MGPRPTGSYLLLPTRNPYVTGTELSFLESGLRNKLNIRTQRAASAAAIIIIIIIINVKVR
jgi:hypothetical protein